MKLKYFPLCLAALLFTACSKPEKESAATGPAPAAEESAAAEEDDSFASPFMESLVGQMFGADGEKSDPRDFTGARQTLVYFSASWCGPCKVFTPKLVEAYYTLRGAGIQVVMANQDKSQQEMLNYMTAFSHPWPGIPPEAQNDNSVDLKEFQENGIPSLALIDADGKLVKKGLAQEILTEVLEEIGK